MPSSSELTETIRQLIDVITTRSMHEWSRYVKTTGLSMPQFGILMHLYYRSSCGISHLSEHLDVSAPAASQLVDRLVQHGLVERIEDPIDRRAKQLTLTPKGRELIETGLTLRTRWVDELIMSLKPEDYNQVAATLSKLTEAVRELEQAKVSTSLERK
jgi:DNA-binding MarR family transcriptional regulator